MKIINLTKDYILKYISQESIFESFLNTTIDLNSKYLSPFRNNDKIPSCSFYYKNGKLRFKDFGGDFNGDCFDFVGYHLGLKSNQKRDFIIILHSIASHFGILGYKKIIDRKIVTNETIETKKKLTYIITQFGQEDVEYWNNYHIKVKDLPSKFVYRVKSLWIDNNLYYLYNQNNPCYIYIFSKVDYRFYFPLSKYNKFITTSNCVQGLHLLEKSDFVIITKSMKDTIVLHSFSLKGKRIQSFSLGSENSLLDEKLFLKLKTVYKIIFTLFDYDRQGLDCSIRHRRKYNTIPLFIKQETWNSNIKYKIKDFSDYVKYNGIAETKKLINKTHEIFGHLL